MNDERFLKRFRLFRTLGVGERGEGGFDWCLSLSSGSCEVMDYDAFAEAELAPPPHLLLMDFGAFPRENALGKKVVERVRKRPFWQALLLYGKEDAKEAREFALAHHFFGAYPRPQGEEEAIRLLSAVLPVLLERLQEQTRAAQLQKIVDMAPPLVLTGAGDQTLFLNPAARTLFGVTESGDFTKRVLPALRESGLAEEGKEGSFVRFGEKKLLAHCNGEGRERLCTFLPLAPEFDVERRGFLSRVEIIDRLKDRMAQRIEPEKEPLTVMLARLGNLRGVAENFGWLTAHTVSKEFAEALCRHFPSIDTHGLWNCDMLVAVFAEARTEKVRERLGGFVAELQIMDFAQKVTLRADFVLVEVESDDLGALVNLISKAFEENLSVTDTRGFSLYRTGTAAESPDEAQLLRQFMTNIMANRLPVKLLNIYKGIPISTPTKVLKMDDEKVVVTAEKIQKFVMEIEKRVVVQSPHLPGDVEAEVHFTDPARPLAILKNLKMLHTSINNRKHTRVAVTSRLPVVMKVGKRQYTGYVIDLSINSVAVSFKPGRFAPNELKDERVTVSFRLPWENEEGSVNIEVEATVLFNRDEREHHKVVVMLEPDDVSESYIFDYIYKRQKELIKEIKSRIG